MSRTVPAKKTPPSVAKPATKAKAVAKPASKKAIAAPLPKVVKAPKPTLSLSLQFADKRHKDLLPRTLVSRWIKASLASDAELAVRLVDAEEGQALNRDYRQKDYATNVLTFDYAHEPVVMADLIICAPVIEQEAREQNKDLVAHYAHMLVHGTLHAQGWDHEDPQEAEAMEAREREILAGLGFDDPYAG